MEVKIRDSGTGAFLWIFRKNVKTAFYRTPPHDYFFKYDYQRGYKEMNLFTI